MRRTIIFNLFGFVLMIALLSGPGCKNTKRIISSEIKNADSELLYNSISESKIDYEWFTGKAKARIEFEGSRIGATAHFRMIKDSIIWVSVHKLGIELGRALIKKDSAFLIDRINREFYASSLASYKEKYLIPFTFEDLQDILAGNPLLIDRANDHMDKMENFYILSLSSLNGVMAKYWMDVYGLKILKANIKDPEERELMVEYDNYKEIASKLLPYTRNHLLYIGEELTGFDLSFSTIEINEPKSIRFEIPKHYTRID
jgi:hypothetical protein